jgi:hypothetical protein
MGRYSKFKPIKNLNPNVGTLGDLYYKTVFYPEVEESEEDIYVITDFGDRLDLLANQFYNDVTLYWVISIANPNVMNFGSLTITEGKQLRIPAPQRLPDILDTYNIMNND